MHENDVDLPRSNPIFELTQGMKAYKVYTKYEGEVL